MCFGCRNVVTMKVTIGERDELVNRGITLEKSDSRYRLFARRTSTNRMARDVLSVVEVTAVCFR